MRFQMNPGTSLVAISGVLSICLATSRRKAVVFLDVCGPGMISTTPVRWAGFKKWKPANRLGHMSGDATSPIVKLEVLVVMIALGWHHGSIRRSSACLVSRSSTMVSTTRSASVKVPSSISAGTTTASAHLDAVAAALSRPAGVRPAIATDHPAAANAAAISGPMAPVPMTTAFIVISGAPGASRRPCRPAAECWDRPGCEEPPCRTRRSSRPGDPSSPAG